MIVERTVPVTKEIVKWGKEPQHTLMRQQVGSIERSYLVAPYLTEKSKRLGIYLTVFMHVHCRIRHIIRQVGCSPPVAFSNERLGGWLSQKFYSHSSNTSVEITIFVTIKRVTARTAKHCQGEQGCQHNEENAHNNEDECRHSYNAAHGINQDED